MILRLLGERMESGEQCNHHPHQPRPPVRRSGCIPELPYPPTGPARLYLFQPWQESEKSRERKRAIISPRR
jgi:hypothetical protein